MKKIHNVIEILKSFNYTKLKQNLVNTAKLGVGKFAPGLWRCKKNHYFFIFLKFKKMAQLSYKD